MPTNVPTNEEFKALEARVAKLEDGSVTPPVEPPVGGDASPDGATAMDPGVELVSSGGNRFELCELPNADDNYGILYNGTHDPVTHNVEQLYAKGGVIYQEAGGAWYASDDDGGWSWSPTDPTGENGTDPGPIDPPTPPAEGTGPQLFGLYTMSPGGETWNFGNGLDQLLLDGIAIFEAESGKTVNAYDYFPTWGDQNWWGANLKNMLAAAANFEKGRTLMPCIGIKMFWSNTEPQNYGWNDPQGFTDNINGRWDHVWSGMVDACADTGFNTAIFRISYEHNFSFMPDSPGWDSGAQQLWKQAFEHISAVIRAQAQARGIVGLIALNPTLGGGSQPVESYAPHPNSYDICATDAYNGYYPPAEWGNTQAERDEFWSNTYYGMTHHLNLAKLGNKPVMFPEIGAGDRPDGHGKNNDSDFWHWVADKAVKQVREAGLPMQGLCFWDVPAGDITARMSDGAQPPCMEAVNQHADEFMGDPLWREQAMEEGMPPFPMPATTETYPLSNPPSTPMQVDPKTFNGRDPRAIAEWLRETAERRANRRARRT